MVATVARLPMMLDTPASNHARIPLVANSIASPISGGIETDASWLLRRRDPCLQ